MNSACHRTTVGLVSLGCAKNLVDAEAMLGWLVREGFKITTNPAEADVIIVNTCGFIHSAKQESVDTILEMAQWKTRGSCKKLIVSGCLAQRYHNELRKSLPEVDAFIGLDQTADIVRVCREASMRGDLVPRGKPRWLYDFQVNRVISTPHHYAYLKIAEGCNHTCTFCAIPSIRGRYRSRYPDSIVREARSLSEQGVQELILIAQDTTLYGIDLGIREGLYKLLDQLHEIEGIRWIRILYMYPDTIPKDFAQNIRNYPKLVHYIDIPLQHCHPDILKQMQRNGSRNRYRKLLESFRDVDDDFTLRTTFIVGFPGETESHFQEVLDFIRDIEFDHVGVFLYSDEEGTAAYHLPEKVPPAMASERYSRIMEVQQEIVSIRQSKRVNRVYDVIIDTSKPGDDRVTMNYGRFFGQAPEIDGVTLIRSHVPLKPGTWYPVQIQDYCFYDLIGEPVHVFSSGYLTSA